VNASSAVPSGNGSAQNGSTASHTITKEHENEWIAVFSGAIDRLNSSARAAANGVRQNTVQPNTYAPAQNTVQPNTYAPVQNTVQSVAKQKKGNSKVYIICFILNIILPYIFFNEIINGVKLFTVETDLFYEMSMSYSVISLVLAVLSLLVTLIISINSHCKNEKLRSKKPTGLLVTSIVFLAIFVFVAFATYNGIAQFDEESANSAASALFVCLYFMLHHLICYFAVKKMQNKNRR
jgi:glucan phosphoethanolaminetransferase (alkaline phosphatase superfamily)